MAGGQGLTEYAAKRTFTQTPEPRAEQTAPRDGPLLFVVQQHAARRLHFDFRLELDGVLKSWAVPKGVSLDPHERRLAVATEDHPFDYASFEGVIPAGQYGAGQVIVWDCGVYAPYGDESAPFGDRAACERILRKAYAAGKLKIDLRGVKLKGEFALVRSADAKNWLLIKHGDRFASAPGGRSWGGIDADASPLSGRTVKSVAFAPVPPRLAAGALVPGGRPEATPPILAPMMAQTAAAIPKGAGWMFEPKLDGYRVLARVRGGKATLTSRGGEDYSRAFPEIVEELELHGAADTLILDGELVALDEQGRPGFNAIQNRAQLKSARDIEQARRNSPAMLYCFDILHFGGRNLRECSYADRRRYLLQCLLPSPHVLSVHADPDGPALYRAAVEAGFEGVMAKELASAYTPGRRTPHWLKLKAFMSAEFVIGGYTRGQGARRRFGALLVGYWEKRALQYAGHCGTGFDDGMIELLLAQFAAIEAADCPFAEAPELHAETVWLKPVTVAELKFAEWTPDGRLRAPVFLRLRPEIAASSVRRVRTDGSALSADADADGDTAAPAHKHAAPKERRATAAALKKSAAPRTNTDPEAARTRAACDAVLEQLGKAAARATVELEGERVALTHLDRVYWPEDAALRQPPVTKRDLLRYLAAVAPYMLTHLRDRPLTMIRMPEGIHGERFFQKHWDQPMPRFVETIEVFSESRNERQRYLLCNNAATLLWLGQMGTLEFHVWHSRASTAPEGEGSTDFTSSPEAMDGSILNFPDYLVFDIDPYIYSGKEAPGAEPELNDAAFEKGKEVAFWLNELLGQMSLQAVVKTSGKTGLHLFVPIRRTIDFDAARQACEMIGRHLMSSHRRDITMEWSVNKRTGKIFIDYNMNARAKTLNSAYSPRGVAGAPVSMPLTWDELARAHPLDFRLTDAPDRIRHTGDRWASVLDMKQSLEEKLIIR
jgi:bifunctional non-homologous end joining protein LigD